MTTKLLKALRDLFSEEKSMELPSTSDLFVVDHSGRIAGCHIHNFAGSVFELLKKWKSEEFTTLKDLPEMLTVHLPLLYFL
jgi:hypothetical protein